MYRTAQQASIFSARLIAEGCLDYVAPESNFPAERLRLLSPGAGRDPAPLFKHAVYRRMVTHAVDAEGYSFDQFVARAGEARTIKAQMLAASRRDAEQSGRSAGVPDTARITD